LMDLFTLFLSQNAFESGIQCGVVDIWVCHIECEVYGDGLWWYSGGLRCIVTDKESEGCQVKTRLSRSPSTPEHPPLCSSIVHPAQGFPVRSAWGSCGEPTLWGLRFRPGGKHGDKMICWMASWKWDFWQMNLGIRLLKST
jgi:hypothetical protein